MEPYGTLLALGACLCLTLSARAADRMGLPSGALLASLLAGYAAALVGARAVFVAEHLDGLADPLSTLATPVAGGLSSAGALVGGALAVVLSLHILAVPVGPALDACAQGLCALGAATRLGCFLGGCCYGRPTALPWSVTPPPGSLTAGLASVHPTPLYEAGCLVAVWVWLARRPAGVAPQMLRLSVAYAIVRFGLDFTRDGLGRYAGLSLVQWLAVVTLVCLAVRGRPRGNPEGPTGVPWERRLRRR